MSIYKLKKYIYYENLLKHGLVKLKTIHMYLFCRKKCKRPQTIYIKLGLNLKLSVIES